MEQFIIDQITSGLKYVPSNIVKSFFIASSNEETKKMREKGFIYGVCHCHEAFDRLNEANLGWARHDIPYPFDKDGNVTESFKEFKAMCARYKEHGIKVMAITPYPESCFKAGYDCRTPEGEQKLRESARFIINELRDVIGGLQVTNEMGHPNFTPPLESISEAARYIGVQLEEIYPLRGDVIIGYNSAGPQADLHSRMLPYIKYCDYVGIDIYLGCFMYMPGFMGIFTLLTRYLWALTGKPILIQEFGYMSGGVPRTKQDRINILKSYGFKNEADVKARPAEFVEALNPRFKEQVKKLGKNDPSRYFSVIFKSDIKNHIYREMPRITKIPGYPHSPEGQAKFYRDVLALFYKTQHICGSIIYCYEDSDMCYICGQDDCPIETRWGLVDLKGNPKPAFYEIKKFIETHK